MKQWIEEHPYLTGGLILGLIVLWVIWRNRSSTASSATTSYVGPSESLQAAELSAGIQMQQAQLGAQTQIAGYEAAANIQQLNNAATITQSSIAAGVANEQTAAQLQLGLAPLGLTPSTSPFGLTVPIAGITAGSVAPTLPGNFPVSVVNQQTTNDQATADANAQARAIAAGVASTPSALSGVRGTGPAGVPLAAPLSFPLENCAPLDVACTQRNLASETAGVQQHIQAVQNFNTDVCIAQAGEGYSTPGGVNNFCASTYGGNPNYTPPPQYLNNFTPAPTNIAPPSLFGGAATCAPGLIMDPVTHQCHAA